jgi:Mre11 DNA-binding presumed domain
MMSCRDSFLRRKMQVNALIEKANALWDERNAKAVEDGEEELPRMLPLIRLKVRISPAEHPAFIGC